MFSNFEVGYALKIIRLSRGLSLKQAALQSGFSESCCSKIESGTRGLSFSEAVKFAEIYNMSLDEFVALILNNKKNQSVAEELKKQIKNLKSELKSLR